MLLATGACREQALNLYQEYKWEVISRLTDQQGFVLLGRDTINWLRTTDRMTAKAG